KSLSMSAFGGFGTTQESQKELTPGSPIRHAPTPMAGGMSGRPRELRPGPAAFFHLEGARGRDLPGARPHAAGQALWQRPAGGRGTHERRIACLSWWAKPPGTATLHGLGRLGRCALAPDMACPR